MQKVIGIPNGPSYQTKLNELNSLLELGWKVINVSPIEKTSVYSSGVMYAIELINKPVETTNEQPKEKYNLLEWLKDQTDETLVYFRNNQKDAEIQLCGMSIYLKPDGTYFLSDTTGG